MRWIPLVLVAACQKGTESGPPRDTVPPHETDTETDSETETETETETGPGPEEDACDDAPSSILCDGADAITCDEAGDVVAVTPCTPPEQVCVEGVGCGDCLTTEVPWAEQAAALGVPITVWRHDPRDPTAAIDHRPEMVPLVVRSDAPGTSATIAVSGALTVYDEAGAPATTAAYPLPATWWVDGAALGDGAVEVTSSCGVVAGWSFVVRRDPGLAGRSLPAFPWFDRVGAIERDTALQVAFDPRLAPERVGAGAEVFVVDHKDLTEWAADPALVDVTGGVESVTVGADLASSRWEVWADPADDGGVGRPLDVVFDFDRDGVLSPGDQLDGGSEPGVTLIGDLTAPGPNAVTRTYVNGGLWLGEVVYYPSDIGKMGPVPLVVISHGNGHEFTWYDYLGEHLASYGYVVMAHQNNTGPGIETASTTTLDNTDWFLSNLASIDKGVLDGHVDGHRIVWVGHSRGGEGVARAYDRLFDGETRDTFTWADVALVASIAPTVFNDVEDSDTHEAPYFLIYGAADGDVSGAPSCPQCLSFRLSQHAQGFTRTTYLQGVGHNEFNCCGFDDAQGPDKVGRDATQVFAKAYFLAILEQQTRGNDALADYFGRPYDTFRPGSVEPTIVATHTWRDPLAGRGLVVDDFEAEDDPAVTSEGAPVTWTGVTPVVETEWLDDDERFLWTGIEVANGMTQSLASDPPARGAMLTWAEGEEPVLTVGMPGGSADLSAWDVLSLRAAQVTRAPETDAWDAPLSFAVSLVDGAGVVSTIDAGDWGALSDPYERTGSGSGTGWANELVTLRLPLDAFLADGAPLDLSDVVAVRLEFGTAGSETGRIGVDDLEVTAWMPPVEVP